ncbi:PREDICTED: uncharacterized protein LOC109487258 [Branchiostoma belcheri]|uniref:Uncharacterized protein LOC109487258 n=1 Tax=Branchiostoma belcheri TaxID=7741 RepID=A0A6P5AXM6_BRABE|nr:PREDICTED: uncharacterized protein LOC109487258 [Branchiostoma belcheri]
MSGETSDEELEDGHTALLRGKCRLCGQDVNDRKNPCSSLTYKQEFVNLFGIDLTSDVPSIHPPDICHKCRCVFDRYRRTPSKDGFTTRTTPYLFVAHSDACQLCYDKTAADHNYVAEKQANKGGRKRKVVRNSGPGRGGKRLAEHDQGGSTEEHDQGGITESGIQTDPAEVAEASTQTDSNVCGYIINPLQPNLDEVPVPIICTLVSEAASSQREAILQDISDIGGLYKKPETLVDTDPNKYFANRNAVCQSFLNGLADKRASIASKVMSLEQLYHLASPALVAPFSFSRNLLSYAITNSKLVVNMLGKVSAGGMIDTVKSYLQNIASKPLPFPNGDCEVAIDNDQKLKKQWSVRAQGKMTCSVVTSVCQVQHSDRMEVQGRGDLSPACWGNYLERAQEEEETKELLRGCINTSKTSEAIHRGEVRKLVHERLGKVLNEQLLEEDTYVDYVDKQVEEKERSKTLKKCAACGTEVPRTKRICPNQECQANLKQVEEAASGRDVFGTMLLQEVRKYSYRPKEREIQISIDNDKTTTSQDITIITAEENSDIPSLHPDSPPPITMSDPVFVNPNSASAMRKVLRHVGKIANVARYSDSHDQTNTRSWLVVAMDGLPLGITRTVISQTMYCTSCKHSFDNIKLFQDHISIDHPQNQTIPVCREFDWVILRVGKLHMEMNALKAYVDLNWDVWFAELAQEMGFQSEGAQRVAKNCADHHKSMQMLQIAIKGCTDEMLLPYVRHKLGRGEKNTITADDFLYNWLPHIRNPNYIFLQQQINLYGLAIQNFRVGTRRNNTGYVQAGMEVFSPLFSGRNHPKYQAIDLLESMDRTMYPPDLRSFMEKTESVSSGGKSVGEGMDAKLEEKNKASKAWHKGAPLAADWIRVFRNLDVLEKLRAHFFSVISVPDSSSSHSHRYNLEPEVDVWRTRLRSEQYLREPFNADVAHTSISGKQLTSDLLDFEKIARKNKSKVFEEVYLEGKQKSEVKQTCVYVTEEEKCREENISRQTKVTIVQKTKDLLSQFVVEDVKMYYVDRLSAMEKRIGTTKKEDLLELYFEVENEATEQDNIHCALQLDMLADAGQTE